MGNEDLDVFKSVGSQELKDISSSMLEVGLDSMMEPGVLKDLPIVGVVFKSYDLIQKLKAIGYSKKILKFLYQLKDIPVKKRQEYIKKLEDEKENIKTSDALRLLIERLDEINKASIIGKLFAACINEDISLDDFFRLSYMVEKVFLNDLLELGKDPFRLVSFDIQINLFRVGFLDQTLIGTGNRITHGSTIQTPQIKYELNKLGHKFRLIYFGLDEYTRLHRSS